MQKPLQTQDIDDGKVYVATKPYSQKKITGRTRRARLIVSIGTFASDLYVFDADIRSRYTNAQVTAVLKSIFKKVTERIIRKLWRMPFPNGSGSLYMQQRQIVRRVRPADAPKKSLKSAMDEIMRDESYLMRRAFLKWNKTGKKMPYKDIWRVKSSAGLFRSIKYDEVIGRENDREKQDYRAHII